MRELRHANLDQTRPVVVLTRETARAAMTKVTVAPIMASGKGLTSEVHVGAQNGLDHDGVISLDNAVTIPTDLLGENIGYLTADRERLLARAMILAYDLDLPLVDTMIQDPDPDPGFQPLSLVQPVSTSLEEIADHEPDPDR
jgi:mRNA interferase MazF